MNIGIDIHSLTIGGSSIPFGYVLLFCFIGILFLIIWLLSKYLFVPFVRGKWDSIEKVGRLLPEVDKLIAQNEKLQLSYESLNHSVRTDLVHKVGDLSNSVSGIMLPIATVEQSSYWIQLFSHNRDAVWKGMLQIGLNTPTDDADALMFLNAI